MWLVPVHVGWAFSELPAAGAVLWPWRNVTAIPADSPHTSLRSMGKRAPARARLPGPQKVMAGDASPTALTVSAPVEIQGRFWLVPLPATAAGSSTTDIKTSFKYCGLLLSFFYFNQAGRWVSGGGGDMMGAGIYGTSHQEGRLPASAPRLRAVTLQGH